MDTIEGNQVIVTSSHHQMINPYELPKDTYKVLGWPSNNISNTYTDGKGKEKWLHQSFKEVECIYFPETKTLGFQYHPEWFPRNERYTSALKWTREQVKLLLEDKLETKKKKEIA